MLVRELFVVLAAVEILVAVDGNSCQTPNGQDGNCKPINECRSLSSLLETSLPEKGTFLRKHHCGYLRQIPKVCCPLSDNLISPDTCGRDITRKIVGGEKTELDEFPWTAILEYERKSNGKTYIDCGGVLISSRYVLTAAHCIKTNLVRVRLGEYDTKKNPDCTTTSVGVECAPEPVTIAIEEKISHESYNPDDLNQYNDIALLRLKENVTFTDFIKPICLPNKNEDLIGKSLHVAGWGLTENGSASDVKLKVQVPVKAKSECELTFRSFNYNLNLTASQLCVGGEKGKDSCKGDSGGPLMTVRFDKNRDPQWYSEGIVSFGATPCGMRNWPGIYTKTAEYIPWIMSKMRT